MTVASWPYDKSVATRSEPIQPATCDKNILSHIVLRFSRVGAGNTSRH